MLPFILVLLDTQPFKWRLGGFETKSELFCFAFKALQNHLALLSFQVRPVSSLSYKNIPLPASVPLYEHVKLTWPKSFSLVLAHLLPHVLHTAKELAVPWKKKKKKHLSLDFCTCFLLYPWSLQTRGTSFVNASFLLHSRQNNHIFLWAAVVLYTYFCYSPYTILHRFDYILVWLLFRLWELPSQNSVRLGFKTRSVTSNSSQLFRTPSNSL